MQWATAPTTWVSQDCFLDDLLRGESVVEFGAHDVAVSALVWSNVLERLLWFDYNLLCHLWAIKTSASSVLSVFKQEQICGQVTCDCNIFNSQSEASWGMERKCANNTTFYSLESIDQNTRVNRSKHRSESIVSPEWIDRFTGVKWSFHSNLIFSGLGNLPNRPVEGPTFDGNTSKVIIREVADFRGECSRELIREFFITQCL